MSKTIPAIVLDPKTHTYTCEGRKLESVGGIVKRLTPPFDREGLSAQVAAKRGITQEAVLKEWEEKRNTANVKGAWVHDAIQGWLGNKGFAGKPPSAEADSAYALWLFWWADAKANLQTIGIERIVGNLDLGIAGTYDLLAKSKKTNKHHIFDWKTNIKFETKNDWGRSMLPPFNDLPDCQLSHYSLQTSLYRLMEEKNGTDCGESWVIHVNSAVTPYKAIDLRQRLEKWLKEVGHKWS